MAGAEVVKIDAPSLHEHTHGGVEVFRLIRPDMYPGVGTCNIAWLKPGQDVELHGPHTGDELFVVFHGETKMEIDGISYFLSTNETITVPSGTRHHFINVGQDTAVFLTLRLQPDEHKTL
ncbi:MAG TPA: cupin domain-containing protein [Candidatus Saccharimonadia bacterium]|nr:cupin domain-containing protein [Candidatus Saccharimonadia bacterium]